MSVEKLNDLEPVEVAVELQSGMIEARFGSRNHLTLLSGETYHLRWTTDQSEEEIEANLREDHGVSVRYKDEGRTYHTHIEDFQVKTIERSDDTREVIAVSDNPEDVVHGYDQVSNGYGATDPMSSEDLKALEETLRELD